MILIKKYAALNANSQSKSAKIIILEFITLIDIKLIWVPIQKSAPTKNMLLMFFKIAKTCSLKFSWLPAKIAKMKAKTNIGNMLFVLLLFLLTTPKIIIKGISQSVLPNFNVVAVSTELSLKDIEAPITELVSWTAKAIHEPNCSEDISILFPNN